MLLREHGRETSARLGALFAVGTAAYAITSAAAFRGHSDPVAVPLLALSAGNNVVFWLLAAALFDDAFRLRWWHAGLWLLLVVLGTAQCLVFSPPAPAAEGLGLALTLSSLGFAALAIARTVVSWRADLVEGRRRLRVFIVGASAAYIAIAAVFQLAGARPGSAAPSVAGAIGLLAISAIVAWSLLRLSGSQVLFVSTATAPGRPDASPGLAAEAPAGPGRPAAPGDPADRTLLAALDRSMTLDRVYRQEGLTIGSLAQALGLPEYRLRRLINQALGYRNFNNFLNSYRIAEVKAALADPAQVQVPVLTLALDAGFSSLGPFNRAFKAATGMTPSEYRRLQGNAAGTSATTPGIGPSIPESASVSSKSARGMSPAP
ncbi:MAG: helix-turn-helix transcriptional regulator [Proteobacteria bacterium]|nr:helix-turn-helix transcriptional regulator [Pseudomonadota bacterium]